MNNLLNYSNFIKESNNFKIDPPKKLFKYDEWIDSSLNEGWKDVFTKFLVGASLIGSTLGGYASPTKSEQITPTNKTEINIDDEKKDKIETISAEAKSKDINMAENEALSNLRLEILKKFGLKEGSFRNLGKKINTKVYQRKLDDGTIMYRAVATASNILLSDIIGSEPTTYNKLVQPSDTTSNQIKDGLTPILMGKYINSLMSENKIFPMSNDAESARELINFLKTSGKNFKMIKVDNTSGYKNFQLFKTQQGSILAVVAIN